MLAHLRTQDQSNMMHLPSAWRGGAACGPRAWPLMGCKLVSGCGRPSSALMRPLQNSIRAGPVDAVVDAHKRLEQGISIRSLLLSSLTASLWLGFPFQVTHNNGLLPVYDMWALKIGPFLESGLVPLVLAPIWLSYGYAFPLLDQAFYGNVQPPQVASSPEAASRRTVQTWVLCAAQFVLSDVLYLGGTPHLQIYPVMAACTAAVWWLTDRSKTGLVLGALLAVGAPLAEAGIVALGLWHYDRPDNPLGVCFWTAFCYASYGIGVGNFARWQVQKQLRSK